MLTVKALIMANTYRDSVFLMTLSGQAKEQSGAHQVSAMMATKRNKELFTHSGLSTPEIEAAKPDDLVIAVEAETSKIDEALEHIRQMLDSKAANKKTNETQNTPQSIEQAKQENPHLELVLISVAGDYAKYEALKAIQADLDVMLYSDNISLQDELTLKQMAQRKNRLVMGPDCGTAIINGTPLAFANKVRTGPIGLIGASGTGLQEVCCLLDRFGTGISNAYGTGGRDLKDEIGGISASVAIERLAADPKTTIIGLIGKPPGPKTRQKLLDQLVRSGKAVFVHYLGTADYDAEKAQGVGYATNLTTFATILAKHVQPTLDIQAILGTPCALPKPKKGFIRGLFSGGTLCQEAAELTAHIVKESLFSNLKIKGFETIDATEESKGHCFWDFGDDAFTIGRPHPMIAPELRMEKLVEELMKKDVVVILMDMVIGYGAAQNQAELLIKAIDDAAEKSNNASKEICIVLSVCGTEHDTPSRQSHVEALIKAGVKVFGSNAQAALWAAQAVSGKTCTYISINEEA